MKTRLERFKEWFPWIASMVLITITGLCLVAVVISWSFHAIVGMWR